MLKGRARGHQERIIILAHQTESMARQKTLKAIKHYLPKPERKAKADGASGVLAMLRRMKGRQSEKG